MMNIDLRKISKRYTTRWILKNIDLHLTSNTTYGIRGANGSGKSTLLKIISGYLSASVGDIVYTHQAKIIDRDSIYKYVNMWGPHIDMVGELSVQEMVSYYATYNSFQKDISNEHFLEMLQWNVKKNIRISDLSSGQSQRLGLALSIIAQGEILLLDEPGSFLDTDAFDWYKDLLSNYHNDRIVIIASNDEKDLTGSNHLYTINSSGEMTEG
jgi:ABC-type multidrug transport system, ATPase component